MDIRVGAFMNYQFDDIQLVDLPDPEDFRPARENYPEKGRVKQYCGFGWRYATAAIVVEREAIVAVIES